MVISQANNPLIRLSYISKAVTNPGIIYLSHLLMTARMHNLKKKITGLLIFDGVNYAQIIEGRQIEVENLWASIQKDPRHTHIQLLEKVIIPTKQFPHWSMQFHGVTDFEETSPHISFEISDYQKFLPSEIVQICSHVKTRLQSKQ